jgi:hypothetical protein
MNTSHQPPFEMNCAMNRTVHQNRLRFPGVIHVMAVGRVEKTCSLHDALLAEKRVWLSVATDYRELWMRPKTEPVHVFVLCETLSQFELRESCRFIRRDWPHARILVIRDAHGSLDDPPCDECLPPDVPSEILIAAIEKLLSKECE